MATGGDEIETDAEPFTEICQFEDHRYLMNSELKKDNFDILIISHEDDDKLVKEFQRSLERNVTFAVGKERVKPKVELHRELIYEDDSPTPELDFSLSKALVVFLFATHSFSNDDWTVFEGRVSLDSVVKTEHKNNFVFVIHTKPKISRDYTLPSTLASIKDLTFSGNETEDESFYSTVGIILESKTHIQIAKNDELFKKRMIFLSKKHPRVLAHYKLNGVQAQVQSLAISQCQAHLNKRPPVIGQCQDQLNKRPPVISQCQYQLNGRPPVISQCQDQLNKRSPVISQCQDQLNKRPPVISQCQDQLNKRPPVISQCQDQFNKQTPAMGQSIQDKRLCLDGNNSSVPVSMVPNDPNDDTQVDAAPGNANPAVTKKDAAPSNANPAITEVVTAPDNANPAVTKVDATTADANSDVIKVDSAPGNENPVDNENIDIDTALLNVSKRRSPLGRDADENAEEARCLQMVVQSPPGSFGTPEEEDDDIGADNGVIPAQPEVNAENQCDINRTLTNSGYQENSLKSQTGI